jgi:hypothetical protein
MTAYQPEQWHDMSGTARYTRLAAGRLTQSVGCPAEWMGRAGRPVTEEASVTSYWVWAGVR